MNVTEAWTSDLAAARTTAAADLDKLPGRLTKTAIAEQIYRHTSFTSEQARKIQVDNLAKRNTKDQLVRLYSEKAAINPERAAVIELIKELVDTTRTEVTYFGGYLVVTDSIENMRDALNTLIANDIQVWDATNGVIRFASPFN